MKHNKYSIICYKGNKTLYFRVETKNNKTTVGFRVEYEERRNTLVEVAEIVATDKTAWVQYPECKRYFFTRQGAQCAIILKDYFSLNKSLGFYEAIADLIEKRDLNGIDREIFSQIDD